MMRTNQLFKKFIVSLFALILFLFLGSGLSNLTVNARHYHYRYVRRGKRHLRRYHLRYRSRNQAQKTPAIKGGKQRALKRFHVKRMIRHKKVLHIKRSKEAVKSNKLQLKKRNRKALSKHKRKAMHKHHSKMYRLGYNSGMLTPREAYKTSWLTAHNRAFRAGFTLSFKQTDSNIGIGNGPEIVAWRKKDVARRVKLAANYYKRNNIYKLGWISNGENLKPNKRYAKNKSYIQGFSDSYKIEFGTDADTKGVYKEYLKTGRIFA